MPLTSPRGIRLTDNDWELCTKLAQEYKLTPGAWLVNVVIGDWMRAQGHDWQGVGSVGNPQWVARDAGRCVCTAARCAEGSITCETCGKPLF